MSFGAASGVESLLSCGYEDGAWASATVRLLIIRQTKRVKAATEADANPNDAVRPKPRASTPTDKGPDGHTAEPEQRYRMRTVYGRHEQTSVEPVDQGAAY